ncbi:hypothetical protein J6590_072071 [Homalodisca vitripennis]|nr:hypothetical protein J6590_072071 [Homalodisca vitripennis]
MSESEEVLTFNNAVKPWEQAYLGEAEQQNVSCTHGRQLSHLDPEDSNNEDEIDDEGVETRPQLWSCGLNEDY